MASSGTVTTPVIEARVKPADGHDTVLLMGHTQIKSTAVIEAGDLILRTVKGAVVTAYSSQDRAGAPAIAYGSVNVAGSLMNALTITTLRGSVVPHTGTQHVGSRAAGTQKVGFFIIGA